MKKIILIVFVISILSACTDLNDKLYDKIDMNNYPENNVQFKMMLAPILSPLRDYTDWGGYWFAQELTGDGIVCPTRGDDWNDGGKWRVLHTHTWTNDVETVNSMWSRFSQGIMQANKYIEFVQPYVDKGNEDAILNVAKAKTLRAFYFWNAIDTYGDFPYVTVYATEPKNPYLNYKADIWNKIVDELENEVDRKSVG